LAVGKEDNHKNDGMLAMNNSEPVETQDRAKYEWQSFLFIVIFLFPILSVVLVGGYGFIVWAMQAFFIGPPGHG
jgi:nitrate reductase NapE